MEYDKLIAKYISTEIYLGRKYWVLTMEEYDIVNTYRCDKFSILEILQDIDFINSENDCITNYFETFTVILD